MGGDRREYLGTPGGIIVSVVAVVIVAAVLLAPVLLLRRTVGDGSRRDPRGGRHPVPAAAGARRTQVRRRAGLSAGILEELLFRLGAAGAAVRHPRVGPLASSSRP